MYAVCMYVYCIAYYSMHTLNLYLLPYRSFTKDIDYSNNIPLMGPDSFKFQSPAIKTIPNSTGPTTKISMYTVRTKVFLQFVFIFTKNTSTYVSIYLCIE